MRRRQFLPTAVCAALLSRVAAAAPFVMAEIAPGIHVRHGVHEEATAANQDGIANIGFVVGEKSVAIIDPGGSRDDGQALRSHVRAVTDLPISHVVLTHFHPDHVFGCVAFEADKPHFVAHARALALLVTRGEFYRNSLADILGLEAAGDYEKPAMLVTDRATIDLGGRSLSLQAHRTAHTDNDLTILDDRTATLWTGDLLFIDRVPAIDGSILGWRAVIDTLRQMPVKLAVPGHGPVSVAWPAGLDDESRYLDLLTREIRAVIARGGSIEEAVGTVGLSERSRWLLFDDYNGRNVTTAFKELEWE